MNNHYNLKESIYLDASATSPIHKSVVEEITRINTKYWGNPSSIHSHGIDAAEIMETARFSIANKLGCSYKNIIFTSGATESVHLAIKGVSRSMQPGRIIISTVEHSSVQDAAQSLIKEGWDIQYWPVDHDGIIDLNVLAFG